MAGNQMTTAIKSAGNIKTLTYKTGDVATGTLDVAVLSQPATIIGASIIFEGAGTSPVGSVGVGGGTHASPTSVCAAVAFSSVAAGVVTQVPVTVPAAAVRAAGDVITLAWTKTSGTLPAGTVTIEYFNHEV